MRHFVTLLFQVHASGNQTWALKLITSQNELVANYVVLSKYFNKLLGDHLD